jgi:hypothetical protein
MNAKTYNIGCEVMMTAYNGASRRQAVREDVITGVVVKVTQNYVHIRSYEDNKIWKSPR